MEREVKLLAESERKWVEPGVEHRKGRFSPAEEATLKAAIVEYANGQNVSFETLLTLLSEPCPEKTKGVWTRIAACLPHRSVLAVQNFCRRRFNPLNYSHRWSKAEEERLAKLVARHGHKWSLIARELKRTLHNVRDKWRVLSSANKRVSDRPAWSLDETLRLVRAVESCSRETLLQETDEALRDEFKQSAKAFLENEASVESVTQHNKLVAGFVRRHLREGAGEAPVAWETVVKSCPGRSLDSCKAYWRGLVGASEKERAAKLLREKLQLMRLLRRNAVGKGRLEEWLRRRVAHGLEIWEQLRGEFEGLEEGFPGNAAAVIESLQGRLRAVGAKAKKDRPASYEKAISTRLLEDMKESLGGGG